MTTTDTRPLAPVPTFPFSMFDPVHLGVDEYGEHVYVNLAERNMLLGGEPGGGKSSAENLIVAHGALSYDCRLVLVDGNQVQLGPWRHCADMFIGPSLKDAIAGVRRIPADHEHAAMSGCWPPAAARSPALTASTSTWSSSTSTPTTRPPSARRPSGRTSPRWPGT